jgi:hypothetical protein
MLVFSEFQGEMQHILLANDVSQRENKYMYLGVEKQQQSNVI